MALTAEEKKIVDQYFSSRLVAPSANAPASRSAASERPTPIEQPRSRLQSAANVAQYLLSGKKFLSSLPLGISEESIDNLNPIAGFAIDNLLSPVGLALLIAAPVTGGGSIAARLGVGGAYKAAPAGVRFLGEAAARVGGDLLVSAAATGAGKAVESLVPEDASPWWSVGASLAGGIVGGAAAGNTISRVGVRDITGGIGKDLIAHQGSKYLVDLRSADAIARDIKTADDVGVLKNAPSWVKSGVAKLQSPINPSFGIRSDLEKYELVDTQLRNMANEGANAAMVSLYPSGKNVIPTSKGRVGTQHWTNYFDTPDHPPSVQTQIDRWKEIDAEARARFTANTGVDFSTTYKPVPDGRGGFVKPTNKAEQAVWEKLQKYGRDGDNPEVVLRSTVEAAYDAEIDRSLKQFIEARSFTADQILNASPKGKELVEKWKAAVAEEKVLKERLNQTLRLQRGGKAAQKDYARVLDEQLKETRKKLETLLYPVAEGRVVSPRGGEVGVQGAFFGLAAPLSTPNLPVVPKVPNTTRFLETAAKKEVTRLKQELKNTPYRTKAAKVLRGNIEDAADVRAHLGARMDIEKRIYELETALAKVDDVKAQVALQRLTKTTTADVARRDAALAAARTNQASKALKEFKKSEVKTVPYAALGIDKEGEGVVSKFKGRYLLDSEDQLKRLETWANERIAGEPGALIRFGQNLNDFNRYTSASLDGSGPFTVFFPMLFRDPVIWGKGLYKTWETILFPGTNYGSRQIKYLSDPENMQAIREMISNGVPLGNIEGTISAQRGGWVGAIEDRITNPILKTAGSQTFGRAQTAYEYGVQVARIEAWKAWRKAPEFAGNQRELARLIRNYTNGLDPSNLGVNGRQRAFESILLFSPRLFRSTMGMIGSAMRPWSPEGADSAQTIMRMMASTAGLFAVANFAAGIAEGKSEAEIMKNIEDTTNPLKGRQFLAVQVGDEWYGIGGIMRAVSQTLARSAAQVQGIEGAPEGNPIWDFVQGRTAPLPRTAQAIAEYATGEEHNFLPFDKIEDFPDLVAFSTKGALPFVAQGVLEDGLDPTQIGFQIAGLNAKPIVASDVLNNKAYESFNRPWSELTDYEQKYLKDQVPELVKESSEFGSKSDQAYRAEVKSIDDTANTALVDLNNLFQQGAFSNSDFRDKVETVLRDRWVSQAQNRKSYGALFENEAADSPKRAVTDAYFATFNPVANGGAEIAAGIIDWDHWEQLQAKLQSDISAGAFGDPARARQYLEERKRFELPPELSWYQDAKDTLANSGYYEVTNEIFDKYRSVFSILVPEADSATDLKALADYAASSNDMILATRVEKALSFLNKLDSAAKKQLELTNPEIKKALFALGRTDSPTPTIGGRRT